MRRAPSARVPPSRILRPQPNEAGKEVAMTSFLTGVALALAIAVASGFAEQVLDESTPGAFYTDSTYPDASSWE